MNKIVHSLAFLFTLFVATAQCDSVEVTGDFTISNDMLLSGIYVVSGDFTIESGNTVYITPYSSNSCGELKIYAQSITIEGTINGDFAGYNGGEGGLKGLTVNSATGHTNALTSCTDEGTEGHISIEGGMPGQVGNGPGGGLAGQAGNSGSGSKQYCGSFGDEAGLVGGSGGAGGGAGGSYGGLGSTGQLGGAGSNTASVSGLDIETSYAASAGNGGTGGNTSAIYGTSDGRDISIGSGGAGAGGGGRSYYQGTDGLKGGSGGGMIFLQAQNYLTISGVITVRGEDGKYGGNGGSGDATTDCCSDGCNGCDERTFTCGSGAGGGSGAGSGGGIFIESLGTLDMSGELVATGGTGGLTGAAGTGANCSYSGGGFCSANSMSAADGNTGGNGGDGGGGRIKVYTASCSSFTNTGSFDISGANNGTYQEVCGYANVAEIATEYFHIYPNPASEYIHVELLQNSTADVQIVNQLGQIISSDYIINSTQLSLFNLEAGIYFIQVVQYGKTFTQKFFKR